MPHPIERLRWVARAEGAGVALLTREAAVALAALGDDLPGLVTGCRRIIERHPEMGPLWWLAARMLAAEDPSAEGWEAAAAVQSDDTAGVLAAHLPDDTSVVVLGWPEVTVDALRKRGDIEVLVVESRNEGLHLVRRLTNDGIDAYDVPAAGLGAAVREATMVLLEAEAVGPTGFIAAAGSFAAAAIASQLDRPVWVVAGVGRVLPARLWDALCSRLELVGDPWDLDNEIVPTEWATMICGPSGPQSVAEAIKRADCPIPAELLRWEKP